MTEKAKIDKIIEEFDSVLIRYKLIGGNKIMETEYDIVDYPPFFIEPIFYKEIEWIEFPQKMQIILNKRASRQLISELNQDVIKIENLINQIGVFDTEKENGIFRLYGYK